MKDYAGPINDYVAKSFVGRRFRLEGSGHVRSSIFHLPHLPLLQLGYATELTNAVICFAAT